LVLAVLACLGMPVLSSPARTQTAAPASSRVLIDASMPSQALGRDLLVTLYLPPGYEQAIRHDRLPVLILLHGVNGLGRDWVQKGHLQQTADQMIADGSLPPMIIAMPSSGNSWYVNSRGIGGPGDFETAIGTELPAWLGEKWHAREDGKGRAIAGYSMGGFGAMHLALQHPDHWAAAGALSGTFLTLAAAQGLVPLYNQKIFSGSFGWPFNQTRLIAASPMTLALAVRHRPAPAVYQTCGRDDFLHLARELTAMSMRLQDAGIKVTAGLTKGGHDWDTWRAVLPDLLDFMGKHLRDAPSLPATVMAEAPRNFARDKLAKTPRSIPHLAALVAEHPVIRASSAQTTPDAQPPEGASIP